MADRPDGVLHIRSLRTHHRSSFNRFCWYGVGPGVLGSYLGKLWLERYPSARVIGQTNTDNNHAR